MRTRTLRAGVLALVAAVTLAACSSESSGPVEPPAFDGTHVSASSFEAATTVAGVVVLDVRTPAEYAEGHLPGAVNLNVEDPAFPQLAAGLDPDAQYAIYCRSGNRSRVAQDYLTQIGVAKTVGLDGGIGAWKGDVVTD